MDSMNDQACVTTFKRCIRPLRVAGGSLQVEEAAGEHQPLAMGKDCVGMLIRLIAICVDLMNDDYTIILDKIRHLLLD